jgi:hypothetical protein
MIDVKSATLAAATLTATGAFTITTEPQTIPLKAKDEMQNQGIYDLIFPYLHVDFPTREEIMSYTAQAFLIHAGTNAHNMPLTPFPVSPMMREVSHKDGVIVRAGSPVNGIGYGI